MIGIVKANLVKKAETINGKKGQFVVATIAENHDNKDTVYYDVLGFEGKAQDILLSLEKGELLHVEGTYECDAYKKQSGELGVNQKLTLLRLKQLIDGKMKTVYEKKKG